MKKKVTSQKRGANRRKRVANSYELDVHTSVNLTMDNINIRRVDISLLPSSFDQLVDFAGSFE